MAEQYCGNCRFWKAFTSGTEGYCRRYAPRPTLKPNRDEDGVAVEQPAWWPDTSIDDWCGEWQASPPSSSPAAG